jgi:hypothetical protein
VATDTLGIAGAERTTATIGIIISTTIEPM